MPLPVCRPIDREGIFIRSIVILFPKFKNENESGTLGLYRHSLSKYTIVNVLL